MVASAFMASKSRSILASLVNSWAPAKGPITRKLRARRAAVFISTVYLDHRLKAVPRLLLVEEFGAADLLALENHALDALDLFDFLQRISIHQQEVGVVAFFDQTDTVADADEARRVVSGRLESHGGRDARLHPQLEFA